MEFKKLKINDLKPAAYNPRKALKPGDKEYEKIKKSISEFGYVDPIIVNDDMTVIGGHQRLTVLKDLGYTEIDCVVISIDKTKEKALNIALNKITGEWNKNLLADLIKDLQDSDFDIEFTGFEPPEIEQLFNSVHDKDITEDDFDVEEDIDDSVMKYDSLNLILQPLIENAIEHGIDVMPDDRRGKITIKVKDMGHIIELSVIDNGIGMTKEQASKILTSESRGYGVRNVNERIKLYYGEDYPLIIKSEIGVGTEVIITIPKKSKN